MQKAKKENKHEVQKKGNVAKAFLPVLVNGRYETERQHHSREGPSRVD
jgi:hypothetical protein